MCVSSPPSPVAPLSGGGEGADPLTMRRLADRLNIRPMSVYTYVPSRAELLDLMLDDAYSKMPRPTQDAASWEPRVRAVAGLNLDLHERHPWTAQLSTLRPPLGPGQLSKYDYELSAFDGSGLDDVTTDAPKVFRQAKEIPRRWTVHAQYEERCQMRTSRIRSPSTSMSKRLSTSQRTR